MIWLKHYFGISLLAVIVTGIPTCPSEEFVEERMEATKTVVKSVVKILLNGSTAPGRINATSTIKEIYELIAMTVDSPTSTEGLVEFQKAISEIAAAIHNACSAPEDSIVRAEDVQELISRFVNFTTAGNITKAREVYGMQLCLRDLLSTVNATRTPEEEQARNDLDNFFDSLDGVQTATLFGIEVTSNNNPPTLAFVVDDTGSMGEEIRSVQKLIHSFIRTERTNALAYILTTFNDPGKFIINPSLIRTSTDRIWQSKLI